MTWIDDNSERSAQLRVWTWSALLITLCLVALSVEFRDIAHTLPYPQHVDEPAVATAGARVLTTGSLHPEEFNYPSFPKYLAAVGLAVGVVRAATRLELERVDQIGNVGYPHYDVRTPMASARELYALISALALAATAICGWRAFRRPAAIVLAPLIAVTTPMFFYHSWAYLNVDIVATCLTLATLAACLKGTRQPSIYHSAVLPGVFAGLAIGSKYTMAVAILPVVLGIWLYAPTPNRVRATLITLASTIAAFVIVVPFSVLDIPRFLNGVAYDGWHYAHGHSGFEGPTGLPQLLFYLWHFVSEFGVPAMVLAAVGIAAGVAVDLRRTAILLAYPAVSLWILVSQPVNFTRNVLAFQPIIAIFAAIGLIAVHARAVAWVGRSRWSRLATWRSLRVVAAFALLILAVPPSHLRDVLRDRVDSRLVAADWLESRISSGWTIVVPEQLAFDVRDLEAKGLNVKVVDLVAVRTPAAADALRADVNAPSVILVPTWSYDPNVPGGWKLTPELNRVAERWRPLKRFGSEPVIVNHENHVPAGSPAFSVAALNLPQAGIDWLSRFEDERRRK